jgi:hypothetical protein
MTTHHPIDQGRPSAATSNDENRTVNRMHFRPHELFRGAKGESVSPSNLAVDSFINFVFLNLLGIPSPRQQTNYGEYLAASVAAI